MVVQKHIFEFENWLKDRYPDNTIQSYSFSVKQFLDESNQAFYFNYQEVVDYFARLERAGLSSAYRIKILSAIKLFYDYLISVSVIQEHPCKRFFINDYSLKGVHFENLFSPDELQLLLEREERYQLLALKNKTVLSFLIYQALTGDEIVRLTTHDIDLDSGIVRVRSSARLAGRALELHPTQIMLLLKYVNDIRPQLQKLKTDKLILSKTGNPITVDSIHALVSSMQNLFPGKILNPRSIRQSVMVNWLNIYKYSLSDVQLMAGHRWPSATEKYIRMDMMEKRKYINTIHPAEKFKMIKKHL